MRLFNSARDYGTIPKGLHWLTVALVALAWLLGMFGDDLPKGGAQTTALPEVDCEYPGSHRMGGNTTPPCMADPTPLVSNVVTIMPGDAAEAAGLRKPEIWQTHTMA